MKLFSLVFLSSLLSSFAFAACDLEDLKKQAEGLASSNFYAATLLKIKEEGLLKPGQKMNVVLVVDDFDVKNNTTHDVLVYSAFGSDRFGDDAFWIAEVNATNCRILELREVLHTGGGGL